MYFLYSACILTNALMEYGPHRLKESHYHKIYNFKLSKIWEFIELWTRSTGERNEARYFLTVINLGGSSRLDEPKITSRFNFVVNL